MKTIVNLKECITETSGALVPVLVAMTTQNPAAAAASLVIGPALKGLINGIAIEKEPQQRMDRLIRRVTQEAFTSFKVSADWVDAVAKGLFSLQNTVNYLQTTAPEEQLHQAMRHILAGFPACNIEDLPLDTIANNIVKRIHDGILNDDILRELDTNAATHVNENLLHEIINLLTMPTTYPRWNSFESLGGALTSKPEAVSWGSNRIDIVAKFTDSACWHLWYNGRWQKWESLGGLFNGSPAICSWGSRRLDVFCIGQDSKMYHKWYANSWTDWECLGGSFTSGPAAVSWCSDRIDLFAIGTDQTLWHRWYSNVWSDWETLGGVLTAAPAVTTWGYNRLDVFVRGENMHLYHKWWNGVWSDYEDLGGELAGDPGAVSWGPNRIDVFYPGQNTHTIHIWWDGTRWNEEDLGGLTIYGAGVSSWCSGRLDVFVVGTDFALYHKWYA